ncbi:MAG: hypothetical protein SPJ74_00065 [Bacilli bacterium]|nr:hypothetical protein [Bacilli bacterium]
MIILQVIVIILNLSVMIKKYVRRKRLVDGDIYNVAMIQLLQDYLQGFKSEYPEHFKIEEERRALIESNH